MFDLLFSGGELVDGSGSPRRRVDVAVSAGRVARIGALDQNEARQTIDCRGKVVAPGFVDVHNHDEGWLLRTPHLLPKTSQGITTEILASDGISYAPLSRQNAADWFAYLNPLDALEIDEYRGWQSIADYLSLLDGRLAQNLAIQVPYGNCRVLAAGWGRGALDAAQRTHIRDEIERGMQAGAVGLSTGIDYIGQYCATTDELVDAATAIASRGGLYVTHVRYKLGALGGVKEAVEIARRAGVPLHVSHLKGASAAERDELLDYIDRVAVHEVDFSFDVYPYLPGSTLLAAQLPYETWDDGPLAVPAKLRDADIRRQFVARYAELPHERIRIGRVRSEANARHEGKTLAEYVADVGGGPEALLELLAEESLAVTLVFRTDESDAIVEPMLAHPRHMLGSDGIYFERGQVHPRVWGSATRIIGPMVRRGVLSLEEAVRHCAGWPAERFGLVDRGVVREGAHADLVIFDPVTVSDRATYDDPHQPSIGVEHVLVNGISIIRDGQPVEPAGSHWPGRVLRYKSTS